MGALGYMGSALALSPLYGAYLDPMNKGAYIMVRYINIIRYRIALHRAAKARAKANAHARPIMPLESRAEYGRATMYELDAQRLEDRANYLASLL